MRQLLGRTRLDFVILEADESAAAAIRERLARDNLYGRRVAVVTGGTAGVGRAAVREFARRGYDVAILARGAAGLEGAAADVRKAGGQALPRQLTTAGGLS